MKKVGSLQSCSLYVHVPFCAFKCDYCDFYSLALNSKRALLLDSDLELYVEKTLLQGLELFEKYRPCSVPTLYIGGGTPSVLGPTRMRRLLKGLLELITRFSIAPEEITVEANPESADEALLAALCEQGVSRLSLGVQTFFAPSRQAIKRRGDEKQLSKQLALAAEYFPGAFSIDLISGLPFQSENILLNDISQVLSFSPAHVSLYSLTLDGRTPLSIRAEKNRTLLPGKDETDRLWVLGRDTLEAKGYKQYEVSNFCLPGKQSRHNIRYWRMENWLGLGPGASGTVINDDTGTGLRFTNPEFSHTEAQRHEKKSEVLGTLTLIKESFLMGFRYIEGPCEDLFRRRFNRSIGDCIPKTIKVWRGKGLFREDKIALNKEGLLFLDRFLLDAFGELH